jgi:pyruvate/2-oxoglutarate dehydrogenase complex dihydrolipoamide dehydrogenase (E3) component
MKSECDVIVLGMGTCGEDAALRLAASGLDVVGIEGRLIGGECPYWACIPSKVMIRSANLLTEARRADGRAGSVTVEPDWGMLAARIRSVLVATGSKPLIPPIPGVEDVDSWTNHEAIETEQLPSSLVTSGRRSAAGTYGVGSAGVVELVADRDEDRLLGATAVGPSATEVLGFLALAVQERTPLRRLVHMMYAFPTFYGGVGEAIGGFARGSCESWTRTPCRCSTIQVLRHDITTTCPATRPSSPLHPGSERGRQP